MTVVLNLARWILKKITADVGCSMKKEKSPKMTSCGPSNFVGDRIHLILPKNPKFIGVANLSSTAHIMSKLSTF